MKTMSKAQIYQGQSKVEVATRWESALRRVRGWAAQVLVGDYVQAQVRELEITKKLEVTGGYRFLAEVGEADQTERQRVSGRDRWANIQKLRRMYKGENDWGNQHMGNITDFNSSMQFAQGIRVKPSPRWAAEHESKDKPPELEVWQDFLDFNNLNEEGGIDLGVSGELDGQLLLTWAEDPRAQNVRLWTVPLLETKYKVEFEHLWQPSRALLYPGTDKEQELDYEECVFIRLRGVSNGTYGIPTCARVVTDIEDLDKAGTDLRKINKLFASPTPVFTAKNEQGVDRIWAEIKAINWKIGKALVLAEGDKYELIGPESSSIENLLKEVEMRLKLVSGGTSVPVHFLGYPDLMSNRAVAGLDMKPSVVFAGKGQKRFAGGFDELATKVLPTLEQMHGKVYDPDNITHTFPAPAGDVEGLVAAWLPARLAKQISHETFLLKVGIDDPDEELDMIATELEAEGAPEEDDEAAVTKDRVLTITQRAREQAELEGAA